MINTACQRDDQRNARLPLAEIQGQFGSILPISHPALCRQATEPVLFLGPWCESIYDGVSNLNYAILPNPWDERKRIVEAESYCWDFCQRLFPLLAEQLNLLHGTDHSLRYWQVLLASWLMHTVHVVYDRYLLAQHAQELAPGATVLIPHIAELRPLSTGIDWYYNSWEDWWNLRCFAKLFELLGQPIRYVNVGAPDRPSWKRRRSRIDRLREGLLREVWRLTERVLGQIIFGKPSANGNVLLAVSYHLRPRDWLWLKFSIPDLSVVAPNSWKSPSKSGESFNLQSRSRLANVNLEFKSEFEHVFVTLLPNLLPESFVETYEKVRAVSHTRYGERLKDCVIDGNVMHGYDLALLEYVAKCVGEGRSLFIVQNGGGDGNFRTRPEERLTVELTDGFLSWGWREDGENRKAMPLPSPHLSRLRDQHRGGQKIVLTECEFPRYAYRLMSCPIAGQFKIHQSGVVDYVNSLPEALLERLVYKRYSGDFGWPSLPETLAQLQQTWPGLPPDAHEWNRRARLAVVTYPDTTFIEALVLNVPTIGFWDPNLWEMRSTAQSFFDALREVGVVHHDPSSAAEMTVAVYYEADEWWATSKVQEARLAFLNRYGLNIPHWREAWHEFLSDLSEEGASCIDMVKYST